MGYRSRKQGCLAIPIRKKAQHDTGSESGEREPLSSDSNSDVKLTRYYRVERT